MAHMGFGGYGEGQKAGIASGGVLLRFAQLNDAAERALPHELPDILEQIEALPVSGGLIHASPCAEAACFEAVFRRYETLSGLLDVLFPM